MEDNHSDEEDVQDRGTLGMNAAESVSIVDALVEDNLYTILHCFAPKERSKLKLTCRTWNRLLCSSEILGNFRHTPQVNRFISVNAEYESPTRLLQIPSPGTGTRTHIMSSSHGLICIYSSPNYYIADPIKSALHVLLQPNADHGTAPVGVLTYEPDRKQLLVCVAIPPEYGFILRFEIYNSTSQQWIFYPGFYSSEDSLFLRSAGCHSRGSAFFSTEAGKILEVNLMDTRSAVKIYSLSHLPGEVMTQIDRSIALFRIRFYAGGFILTLRSSQGLMDIPLHHHNLKEVSSQDCEALTSVAYGILMFRVERMLFAYDIVRRRLTLIDTDSNNSKAAQYIPYEYRRTNTDGELGF